MTKKTPIIVQNARRTFDFQSSPMGGGNKRQPSRSFAKFNYKSDFPEPLRAICDALNSLPGISVGGGCCGPEEKSFVYFEVIDNTVGLSFLTRCMDRRYFKFGDRLRVDLTIADIPPNRITYYLETVGRYWDAKGVSFKGPAACEIFDALVENMTYHLNHEAFMSCYDLSTFTLATGQEK